MKNFFKLPQVQDATITINSISGGKPRTLDLALPTGEQEAILKSLPYQKAKYARRKVFFEGSYVFLHYVDLVNDVAHIVAEDDEGDEIEVVVPVNSITLYPQTEEFIEFIQNSSVCHLVKRFGSNGTWGSETADEHVQEYYPLDINEDAKVGDEWLLPPSLSCCPIALSKDGNATVVDLNDGYNTDSLAYAMLPAYVWHKYES